MPIYAYRCETCGFAKDVLQKVSDPVLTDCPSCGQSTFKKQVTAAGFQLKGTGWYVTDFRGGNTNSSAPKTESGNTDNMGKTDSGTTDAAGKSETKAETSAAGSAPATPANPTSSS